ncbi:MAG: HipA domain-containing protein [Solirubrobacteraceae bacterium]
MSTTAPPPTRRRAQLRRDGLPASRPRRPAAKARCASAIPTRRYSWPTNTTACPPSWTSGIFSWPPTTSTATKPATRTSGGSSLGGARPKAHVLDANSRIAIAKFASPSSDRWDVMRWEAVCLTLARRARINVPDHALHVIDGKAVLVIDRFDRDDQRRVGYSAP